jgi:hypothetical protein
LSVAAGLAWRYVTHALMLGLALWNEGRPAPSLPDTLLEHIPRSAFLARHNYTLWLLAYLPAGLWLWAKDRRLFVRFLWVGGWVSLLRGLTICATGLGPVDGHDVNAGLDAATRLQAFLAIVNPLSALTTDAPHVYLTKDLFFSGHTSSTFLLWLYARRIPRLGPVALAAHVATVGVVFAAHLHYTIDVIGAWALTYAVYRFFEAGPGAERGADAGGAARLAGAETGPEAGAGDADAAAAMRCARASSAARM